MRSLALAMSLGLLLAGSQMAKAEYLNSAGVMDKCRYLLPFRHYYNSCQQSFWICMSVDRKWGADAKAKATARRNDPKVKADIASCRQETLDNGWRFGVKQWPDKPIPEMQKDIDREKAKARNPG